MNEYMVPSKEFNRFQEAATELENISKLLLFNAFREMGVFCDAGERYHEDELKSKLNIIYQYGRLFGALLGMVEDAGFVYREGKYVFLTRKAEDESIRYKLNNKERMFGDYLYAYPEMKAQIKFLGACVENYPRILTGKIHPAQIMFPKGSMELVENIYKHNASSDYYNGLVTHSVENYIEKQLDFNKTGQIRILEIGAGTGGTSKHVLMGISKYNGHIEYVYTDIAKTFIQYGKGMFGNTYGFVDFKELNIENDIEVQGYSPYSFDIVIAANVLHATKYIEKTLKNTRKLLKPRGLLILNEITAFSSFLTLTFGLLDGWWLYEDEDHRISGSPLLSCKMWANQLERAGFAAALALHSKDTTGLKLPQDIILAM
ncbi:class I SAM-dependent methyltransferase [Ruminiclostridium josui]|nr:class I SAM-dependent methyltransferase [Ruminiclostridium josui]